MSASPEDSRGAYVLAVSCNKGGVGKTTVATNLAVYLRALREELPILILSLDDQRTVDRMFSIGSMDRAAKNLKHGWAERSLTSVIRLGEYGVHYVPAPPDVSLLKTRATEPGTLRGVIERTDWGGVVILDTKSDLEALTLNAFHAADRILVPVADWASLDEAQKAMRILERGGLGVEKVRVLFTLADRRTRAGTDGRPLFETLQREADRRGWACYETALSRSPRVEALNSETGKPLSILHHARGTAIHGQFRALAQEVLDEIEASGQVAIAPPRPAPAPRRARKKPQPRSFAEELLGALFRR